MAAPDENHDKEDGDESKPKRLSQHSLLKGNLVFIKLMMLMLMLMMVLMMMMVIMMMVMMVIVEVNIVGDTLQSIDGPEMLPLIADQSESQASSYHHQLFYS